MPNGGSDCCGTCWFNRKNRGERGIPSAPNRDVEPYCEIRHFEIEDPFYTYCANHPHRRPERDPIPIGPVTRYAGDGFSNAREDWIPSPDSEEIRQHLLELLENFFEHVSKSRYPIGPDVGEAVVRQLGEFRERRAEKHIRWISENCPNPWADVARTAVVTDSQGGLTTGPCGRVVTGGGWLGTTCGRTHTHWAFRVLHAEAANG